MIGYQNAYVAGVRAMRKVVEPTGLLRSLDRSKSPRAKHLRTLFSVSDVVEMAKQDLCWWSYLAMDRVAAFLAERPGARVFEYGAGASTVWLARRAGRVDSAEHDLDYVDFVRTLLADLPNVTLHPIPAKPATSQTLVRSGRVGHTDLDFADYIAAIDEVGGDFDLIVVDGRARVEAFRRALDRLAPGGIVVFDNIRRRRYWDAVSVMPGVRIELLKGATPTLPYPTTTGLIWRA